MQEDKEYWSNERKEGPQDCFKWGIGIAWRWAWKGWIVQGVKADCAIPRVGSQALVKAKLSPRWMGCGSADLAAQVVPLLGSQPAACAQCSSCYWSFPPVLGSGSCRTQVGQHIHWHPSLSSGSLGSRLPQLMLGLSSLPQVSRSCLRMWVIWQLFLAAGVTGDNAVTSVKWLPSAGCPHCHL